MSEMSVLQRWVANLPLKMQAVLISAIRRPDIGGGEKVTNAVRWLRYHVLVDGNNGKGSFLKTTEDPICSKEFMTELVTCSLHFTLHLVHAYEIIARKHNNGLVRMVACSFYDGCCCSMHLNPETYDEMQMRLADKYEANCWK